MTYNLQQDNNGQYTRPNYIQTTTNGTYRLKNLHTRRQFQQIYVHMLLTTASQTVQNIIIPIIYFTIAQRSCIWKL